MYHSRLFGKEAAAPLLNPPNRLGDGILPALLTNTQQYQNGFSVLLVFILTFFYSSAYLLISFSWGTGHYVIVSVYGPYKYFC